MLETYKYELELAGLFDEDSDYEGEIGKSVMEILELIDKQGHSGMSTMMVLGILTDLLEMKPLSPITSNPDEWALVHDDGEEKLWQSKRAGTYFSKDGGKTFYDIR